MTELETNQAFEWIRCPWGPALRCGPLAAVAEHCFTTRQPEFPREGLTPGDGWHRVALALGVPPTGVTRLRQVHGTDAVVVRRGSDLPAEWGAADIAVSDDPRVAPSVKVADCSPILIADRSTGAVAAVHAGWRGTAAGAVGAAVTTMARVFGSKPEHLVGAIGPCIGPCCYRVGEDVLAAFAGDPRWRGLVDRWMSQTPVRAARHGVPGTDPAARADGARSWFLDVWTASADQFQRAGVPSAQIHRADLCTSCHRETFHSYRVDGPGAGRMIGVVRAP